VAVGLEGIRIIQTASAAAGPMAGRLLADWGADVICVEHTVRKQQAAKKPDVFQQAKGGRAIASDIDYGAQNHQRNKRSIAVNLSSDSGQQIIYKLLEKADVLLANFRPRELTKFKLEYDTLSQLNPRLICAHLTGFGRKGPDREKPGYGPTGDARSGFLDVLQAPGMEPAQMPLCFADYITGALLAYGIMTALFIREKTGVGQEVDASLFNTMAWAISYDVAGTLATRQGRHASLRKERGTPLQNNYQTKDGRWLYITLTDLYWSKLCQAIGHANLEYDPRFSLPKPRSENHLALFNILDEAFRTKTLDEWDSRLTEAGIPWARLQTLTEIVNDPQARANDFFVPIDHPTYGRMEIMTSPVKLSKTPDTIRMPAPEAGQHTEEVLQEIGYCQEDIARFREHGVIL
jgi:crotonobetainyl-CoA:carnitine CoA-transferase CaiB-like acyl-CoA transferase